MNFIFDTIFSTKKKKEYFKSIHTHSDFRVLADIVLALRTETQTVNETHC